jgi:hypothetical protein
LRHPRFLEYCARAVQRRQIARIQCVETATRARAFAPGHALLPKTSQQPRTHQPDAVLQVRIHQRHARKFAQSRGAGVAEWCAGRIAIGRIAPRPVVVFEGNIAPALDAEARHKIALLRRDLDIGLERGGGRVMTAKVQVGVVGIAAAGVTGQADRWRVQGGQQIRIGSFHAHHRAEGHAAGDSRLDSLRFKTEASQDQSRLPACRAVMTSWCRLHCHPADTPAVIPTVLQDFDRS